MTKKLANIRVARVSTIPFFVVTQLRSQLEAIQQAGAELTVVSSEDELSGQIKLIDGCFFEPVYIAREIRLMKDLSSLYKLYKLFKKQRFDIVHSTTPKAGLLCAIAGKMAGVPVRIHTFTGQAWVSMKGYKKVLLKICDKLTGLLNTQCYADSFGQREFLIQHKILSPSKLHVIGKGSLAGVDLQRFSPSLFTDLQKSQLKASLAIDESTIILLFVGRVTEEKGIFELIQALQLLLKDSQNVVLVIAGPFERQIEEPIKRFAQRTCDDRVLFLGFHSNPEHLFSIADILCLPSYREGFGTVVIEAAAMGVPAVGSRIYGLSDAIIDGETGVLVEPKNPDELYKALNRLLSDEPLRQQMAKQAKARALAAFDCKKCSDLLINKYISLLGL